MTSSGTTRFKFKYFPAPGETPPGRAVFKVSATAMCTAYGSQSTRSAANGFRDALELFEPPAWASSGIHLLERSVGSDGVVVITLPGRTASATAQGFGAGVWADANSAGVALDSRRASISLPNFRAAATGANLSHWYHSNLGGGSKELIYREFNKIATQLEESDSRFDEATFIVAGPTIAMEPPRTSVERGSVFLPVTGDATIEPGSLNNDLYTWNPGQTKLRTWPILDTWFFDEWYQRREDAVVARFMSGTSPFGLFFLGLQYEWDGPLTYPVELRYKWASDGAIATSRRNLVFRPATEEVAQRKFVDQGNSMSPVALSPWIDGGSEFFTYNSSPDGILVAGQTTVALVGMASTVSANVPLAVVAAALGLTLELASGEFESRETLMFRGSPSFAPENSQPEPPNWRQLEGDYTGPFGENNKPHFWWKIYYVKQADVTLSVQNVYNLTGFLRQQPVECVQVLSPLNSSKQYRFWHRLGGEPPRN